jgi:DNA-binding IclR family transcriptional regulator
MDAKLIAAALALQRVAGGRGDGLNTVELRHQTGLKKSAVSRALEELRAGGYVYAHLGQFRMHWFNSEPRKRRPQR